MILVGGRKGTKQRKRKGVSDISRAKEIGYCSHCGGEIRIGTSIMYVGSELRHAYTNSCVRR